MSLNWRSVTGNFGDFLHHFIVLLKARQRQRGSDRRWVTHFFCRLSSRIWMRDESAMNRSVWQSAVLLVLGSSFSMAAVPDDLSIEQIAGYYSARNHHCTEVEQGKSQPCDLENSDWLRIEEIDARHAHFHVYSVQVAGAQCEVEGVAQWDGHALTYKETNKDSSDFGQGVRIEFANKAITFHYLPYPGPIPIFPPFCGARATLEWVEFPLP